MNPIDEKTGALLTTSLQINPQTTSVKVSENGNAPLSGVSPAIEVSNHMNELMNLIHYSTAHHSDELMHLTQSVQQNTYSIDFETLADKLWNELFLR